MFWKEILSVTLILFSIIDIIGNLPVILSLKEKGTKIEPLKTTLAASLIMIIFLFMGELILSLFGVDLGSFAVAGGVVIFIIGIVINGAIIFAVIRSSGIILLAIAIKLIKTNLVL